MLLIMLTILDDPLCLRTTMDCCCYGYSYRSQDTILCVTQTWELSRNRCCIIVYYRVHTYHGKPGKFQSAAMIPPSI